MLSAGAWRYSIIAGEICISCRDAFAKRLCFTIRRLTQPPLQLLRLGPKTRRGA